MVQFHCYDVVDTTKTFEERINFINQTVPRNHCVKHVHTMQVSSHDNALTFHESYKAGGYEGSILRTNDTYKCGRSWNLRKFKDFSDVDARS